ncbi:MAG: sodium:solute symporter family protein [Planctomycetaceae bacterium]
MNVDHDPHLVDLRAAPRHSLAEGRRLGLDQNFSTVDWLIVAAYLVATVGVGVYVNRYIGGISDYLVAGRSLRSSLGIATMVGSELGLVTVMYAAQSGLTGGFSAMHIGLVACVAMLVIGLTGFIVVPLRELGVMTIPEFYGLRFGPNVRVLGALVLALAGILNMGMFLKAGALFVTALTGLDDPQAVNWVMTALLIMVLIYTTFGGMVSVVITDYLQFVLLSLGMLLTCGLSLRYVGWSQMVSTVELVHGEPGVDPLHGDGFGTSYIVWMLFSAGICSGAVWPTAVIRACSADSAATVRRLYAFSSIGFLIRFLMPQFLGICALAYFWHHPAAHDQFFTAEGQLIDDSTLQLQAMPTFLSQILPVGVLGIVGAAMLAAFMSTHDSYLLCWASVLAYDVAAPVSGGRLSEHGCLTLTRVGIVVIGGFLLVWGLWYPLGQNLWDYMAVTGAIYFTGAFAILVGGIYWKRASRTGAMLALLSGAGALVGLKPVQEYLGTDIRSELVGLGTVGLAIVSMILGSLLRPDDSYSRFRDNLAAPPEESNRI